MKLLTGDTEGKQAPAPLPALYPSTMSHSPLSNHPASNGVHSNGSTSPSNNNNNGNIKGLNSGSARHLKQFSTNSFITNKLSSLLDSNPSISPEGTEGECLEYTEVSHYSSVLAGINNLRRQGQFCDIKLVVEDHEFSVHRAVLAVCSPYMFDFFSCLEETTEQQPTYKVKDVPSVGFQYLLDFMYTGSLCVPLNEVPIVYATALLLKMDTASRACADFLSNHLTAANCLGIRQFTKDCVFQASVDQFIRSNLKEIMSSKFFFGLTDLQVEVVGLDETISDEMMERRLFSLVLDWAKTNLNDLKPKMDRLTEKVNVLYLESDNTLRDCADVEDTVLSSDDDVVQDYKIMARRRSKINAKGGSPRCSTNGNGGNAQGFHKFSLNPEEAVSVAEREWSIVATRKTSENAYLAIAILDGRLMAISVHVRPLVCSNNMPDVATNGSGSGPNSPPLSVSTNGNGASPLMSPVVRKASILPLAGMNTARCAQGAVILNDEIIVCGGYDRGECLPSVEAFSLPDNHWRGLPSMNVARGRFSATVLEGGIYVCGGSNGWKELKCVEKYDPLTRTWEFVASMLKERSSHGVVTLEGKLYCIGGCEGQRSTAQCEVYDPTTNKWSHIAPLNTARSQTSVCVMNGLLFAIGGTDLWNTLNTVEVYNPAQDEWTMHSQLNIARRGAGINIVNGMMVVLGGSDGTQSLVSTELYDPVSDLWTMGPPLNTPRANLSAVTLNNRLFAVGGFSGKKFLTTLEWLDTDNMEWLGHVPKPNPQEETSDDSSATAAAPANSGTKSKGGNKKKNKNKGTKAAQGQNTEKSHKCETDKGATTTCVGVGDGAKGEMNVVNGGQRSEGSKDLKPTGTTNGGGDVHSVPYVNEKRS